MFLYAIADRKIPLQLYYVYFPYSGWEPVFKVGVSSLITKQLDWSTTLFKLVLTIIFTQTQSTGFKPERNKLLLATFLPSNHSNLNGEYGTQSDYCQLPICLHFTVYVSSSVYSPLGLKEKVSNVLNNGSRSSHMLRAKRGKKILILVNPSLKLHAFSQKCFN